MKRLLIIGVIFAFLFGNITMASETRLQTMGMGNIFIDGVLFESPNSVIKDEANISLYPSTVNYYPNLFFSEISDEYSSDIAISGNSAVMYKAGAIFQFGADGENPWVLGAHFATTPYEHLIHPYVNNDFYETNHRLNLYYGRRLSDNPFGFTFGYYSSSEKNEDTTTINNMEESLTRYKFGVGLSLMEEKLDLALEFAMTSWTDKDYVFGPDAVEDITKPSGNTDFTLRARFWMDERGKYTMVPHVAFIKSSQGLEDFSWDGAVWAKYSEFSVSITGFDLGLGTNYNAAEDILVASDIGIALLSYKISQDIAAAASTDSEDKGSLKSIPYFRLGLDAEIFTWLDIRCGVVSLWTRYTFENENKDKDVETWTTSETFFGAGFHWGDLEIDASIDPEFLLNGPYFIGGEPTDNNYSGMAGRVTLTYWFDK